MGNLCLESRSVSTSLAGPLTTVMRALDGVFEAFEIGSV